MTKFEQLFKKVDDRLTARRAELRRSREALPNDDPTLSALEAELLEQQIRFRTDRLVIGTPSKPLGKWFFWRIKFKSILQELRKA